MRPETKEAPATPANTEVAPRSSPTPGPWIAKRNTGLRWRIQTSGDKGTLAYMTARPFAHCGNFSYAQIEANARLIAAAPDLLEALKIARQWVFLRGNMEDLAVIDAAIAKATGTEFGGTDLPAAAGITQVL